MKEDKELDKNQITIEDRISQKIANSPSRNLILMQRERKSYFVKNSKKHNRIINLGTNDYLGLSFDKKIIQYACKIAKKYGTASTSSRLISGNLEYHEKLEKLLANLLGYQEALIFGSGTMCNAGVINAIGQKEDYFIIDKLSHASIIDGIKTLGANIIRFKHNDIKDLEGKISRIQTLIKDKNITNAQIFVITESLFSMDGDIAPIEEILNICNKYNAFSIIDESHSIGIFGKKGSGICRNINNDKNKLNTPKERLMPNIITASFGKAFASFGGFCVCDSKIKKLIISTSRPFIFTTAPSPFSVGVVIKALQALNTKRTEKKLTKFIEKCNLFKTYLINEIYLQIQNRQNLHHLRVNLLDNNIKDEEVPHDNPYSLSVFMESKNIMYIPKTDGPIIPIIFCSEALVEELERSLIKENIFTKAIRKPSVPSNSPRLRISLTDLYKTKILLQSAKKIAKQTVNKIEKYYNQ